VRCGEVWQVNCKFQRTAGINRMNDGSWMTVKGTGSLWENKIGHFFSCFFKLIYSSYLFPGGYEEYSFNQMEIFSGS